MNGDELGSLRMSWIGRNEWDEKGLVGMTRDDCGE